MSDILIRLADAANRLTDTYSFTYDGGLRNIDLDLLRIYTDELKEVILEARLIGGKNV